MVERVFTQFINTFYLPRYAIYSNVWRLGVFRYDLVAKITRVFEGSCW